MPAKTRSTPAKPTRQLLHEVNTTTRLHRLVIVRDGRPDSSDWFEYKQIGQFKGIHFSSGMVEGFPAGPFLVRSQAYEVLA